MVVRKVSIITCDQCAHEQRDECDATESISVSFDGGKTVRRVDLCDECAHRWHIMQAVAVTRGQLMPAYRPRLAAVNG